MHRLQLTPDAAYKLALWQQLYEEHIHKKLHQRPLPQHERQEQSNWKDSLEVEHRIATVVRRSAFPVVRHHLPRRQYQPCCLAGSCLRVQGAPIYLHQLLHVGRREVYVCGSHSAAASPAAVRDEDCYCLAHSCSSLGIPVQLHVVGYRSSSSDLKDRYRGLRCLLHHLTLESVRFSGVSTWQDAREVGQELATLLLRTWAGAPRLPIALQTHVLRRLVLEDVPLPPVTLSNLLSVAAAVDSLTHVTLRGIFVEHLDGITAYVRSARTLQHLALHTALHEYPDTEWGDLAAAISSNASIRCWDATNSNWKDDTLATVLAAMTTFVPRSTWSPTDTGCGAGADVGEDPTTEFHFLVGGSDRLTAQCVTILVAAAPASFASALTRLDLCGAPLPSEDVYGPFLAAFPNLCGLNLSECTMGAAAGLPRLLRALGAEDRTSQRGAGPRPAWRHLDFGAWKLPLAALRRIVQQLPLANGVTSLLLRKVDLRDAVVKVPWASCLGRLSELDLRECRLGDDGLLSLATSMEKCSPLPLRSLHLDSNSIGADKKQGERCFQCLCRALRASSAPHLEVLGLASNRLALRPVLALVEQVSATLRELRLGYTSIADDAQARLMLWGAVMRRQRWLAAPTPGSGGGNSGASAALTSFALLDIECKSTVPLEAATGAKEVMEWLATQSAVRVC